MSAYSGFVNEIRPLPTLFFNDICRFWQYVQKKEHNECWEWSGAVSGNGYGSFYIQGNYYKPHRVSFAIENCTNPIDSVIMHTCNNKLCCNPAHLKAGTQSENTRQAYKDGLNLPLQGSARPSSKLTEQQVREIKTKVGRGLAQSDIAEEYGVCRQTISKIATNKKWRHLQ